MEYITLLYDNPKEFLNKLDLMKINKEEFFDYTDTSLLNHYFMTMTNFKKNKANEFNYKRLLSKLHQVCSQFEVFV